MLKTAIVNSRLGLAAFALRDRLALHRAVGNNLESIGTAANDRIARTLAERLCRDGRIFVDVGAHIGSVVNGVRRHSSPAAIVAIEAIPEKADRLRKSFPGVEVHGCAAGEAGGTVTFFVDELRPGFSSLNERLVAGSRTRKIEVPIARLDDIVAYDTVDVVKLIVEGAELGVLRGAERITASGSPTFIFESGADEMEGYSQESLWSWFRDHDYRVLLPNRVGHDDPGMTLEVFLEAHLYPRRTVLYVAVADERRDEIRRRAREILALD